MSDRKYKDGETVYKGKPGDPIPEEYQALVDSGKAMIVHKVENRWLGLPRTVVYAFLVGSLILFLGGFGHIAQAIGYGIALGTAFGITWQFTALTNSYTRLRNLFEEHRAFSNMIQRAISKAIDKGEGTFEEQFGLSKDEDSSDTVH